MLILRLLQVFCGAAICFAANRLWAQSEYSLKPLDTVRITVYQEDDLTTETRIPLSGEINFPLLGTVSLAGKTVKEAVAEIRDRLDRDFIIDPSVNLNVTEYAPERVTVMGQVKNPGTVQIPGDAQMDVLEAIATAGGYTETADATRITLRRRSGKDANLHSINGETLSKPFYLKPMDVIIVGEKAVGRFTVMGQVQKPGVVEIPDNEPLRLLDAIAIAGGYSETANRSQIKVRRRVGGEDKLYLINGKKLANDPEAKPFYMQPNDVVTVAESFF